MFKHFVIICVCALTFGLVGCQEIYDEPTTSNCDETVDASDPQEAFAQALSKAAAESKDLREFIKKTALTRFDKDYDVFVPLVGQREISNDGISLSELVDENLQNGMTTASIQADLPFIDILVPNWEWITGFSANTWDVNDDDICVAFAKGDSLVVYNDGDKLGTLGVGEFPSGPCLIVKNNERMKITGGDTKAGDIQYDFAEDEYNGLNDTTTKVSSTESDIVVDVDEVNDYLDKSEIYSGIITAYEQLGTSTATPQRDYVYFGLENSSSTGTMNTHIYERLYKIKLNTYTSASDDDSDPSLQTVSTKKNGYTTEQILNKIWSDGQFELRVTVYIGLKSGGVTTQEFIILADPEDLFDVNCIHEKFYHRTWFSKRKYIYSVSPTTGLTSKWFTPSSRLLLPLWDLATNSSILTLDVIECDESSTITKTRSVTSTFTTNVNFTAGATTKGGFGLSETTTITNSVSVTRTTGSDDLGYTLLYYTSPVIIGKNGSQYEINTISTGSVDMMILPIYL